MTPLDQYFIERYGLNAYVEHRLSLWAEWYSQNDYQHLNYPKESIESRHLKNGGVVDAYHGPRPLPCNPSAEEVESIIGILMQADEKIAKSLCYHYLNQNEQIAKARASGVSLAQFKINVNYARCWLKGWFHAKYDKLSKK